MIRYVRPAARVGATAVVAATGLMGLASTGQTPSGFVPASFGGPLGLFDSSAVTAMSDVVTIGDGPSDAKELATLLETAGPVTSSPSTPLQATFTPGALPNTAELSVVPAPGVASATTHDQSLSLKPVLDGQGRVDCSKAISCKTDPKTNITTVTYPDGVVAFVQQINELTLVAYKAVGEAIQDGLGALLPKGLGPMPAAAQAPTVVPPSVVAAPPKPKPIEAPTLDARPETRPEAAPVAAGPVAPSAPAAPDISASTVRPQLTISDPPSDFDADKPGNDKVGTAGPKPGGTLGVVKDAVDSVVDAVTGAVGKAIGPGAVTQKTDPSTKSDVTKSDKSSDDKSSDSDGE